MLKTITDKQTRSRSKTVNNNYRHELHVKKILRKRSRSLPCELKDRTETDLERTVSTENMLAVVGNREHGYSGLRRNHTDGRLGCRAGGSLPMIDMMRYVSPSTAQLHRFTEFVHVPVIGSSSPDTARDALAGVLDRTAEEVDLDEDQDTTAEERIHNLR